MSGRGAVAPIILGGMGAGVSDWRLARAVASRGQVGVVSGTGIDCILVRRLQDGDPDGALRRAMARFPIPGVAEQVLERYHLGAGERGRRPYASLPSLRQDERRARQQLLMLASFVEVFLAREGHDGTVGMNLLTRIQLPTLPTLYGAMLAGVECILMGAGIPREIPHALDRLAAHQPASLRLDLEGAPPGHTELVTFDPAGHLRSPDPPLARPRFLAIVASNSLATLLARRCQGGVDGLVVEGPAAGGHNAPPRGEARWNERGEPVYGERDRVDLDQLRALGLPFWLAGGCGRPDALAEARRQGAAGIQVGTLFAFCDESGLSAELKRSVLAHALRGEIEVRTDPRASPTGYPFKVVHWAEDPAQGVSRKRVCDMGYLRVAYLRDSGRVGFRCAGEPVDAFVAKGGRREEAADRRCLCNGLLATIGLAQVRGGGMAEPPIVTSGDDLASIATFLAGRRSYAARDVLDYLGA